MSTYRIVSGLMLALGFFASATQAVDQPVIQVEPNQKGGNITGKELADLLAGVPAVAQPTTDGRYSQ